jgi:CubicO group peptidase (beta-lactamase class C family)
MTRCPKAAPLACLIAWLSIALTCALAQDPTSRGFRDVPEMESFVDGVMAAQQQSFGLAGAVVTVVADDALYFSKGYGYADLAAGRRVDPESTLFRIGSVSKLFIATTVMQLWEQKRLNLDTDVNLYLRPFKVPPTFPRPVTLGHLLAHTAGFEDHVLGLFSHDPADVRPLAVLLADQLPHRVRPPGQFAIYSNHGYALAALAVQEVARIPWEACLEEQILQPLGMSRTTARQPVPPDLAPDLAVGYRRTDGRFQPTPFEFVPVAPAGSMSATGHDMARFMIAHLQSGGSGEPRILSEETAALMRSRLFAGATGINGMLHGFHEMSQNDERIIGHGGGMIGFHTHLALFPERNAGLFVSYNSDTGARAVQDFWQAFLHHYFPAPAPARHARPAPAAWERMQAAVGEYSGLRRSHSSLSKLSALLWTVRVDLEPDGALVTRGWGDEPRRWTEIEPRLFQEIDGTRRLAFRTDDSGRVAWLFPDFPALAFERNPWHQTRLFHLGTLGLALLLLGSALIFWPVTAWCSNYRHESERPPWTPRLWAWCMSLLWLAFFACLLVALADPMQLVFGVPPLLRHALWLPILAGLFVPLALLFTIRAWVNSYWGFLGRAHYTLVTVAALVLLAWLWHWNLLGFRF